LRRKTLRNQCENEPVAPDVLDVRERDKKAADFLKVGGTLLQQHKEQQSELII
jgi:hypothetical protein